MEYVLIDGVCISKTHEVERRAWRNRHLVCNTECMGPTRRCSMIGRRVWTEYMLSLAELFVEESLDIVVMELNAV